MTPGEHKLKLQRLKTAKVALEKGRMRMQSACDFVLNQQSIVNRMEDELTLSEMPQEEAEAMGCPKVSI